MFVLQWSICFTSPNALFRPGPCVSPHRIVLQSTQMHYSLAESDHEVDSHNVMNLWLAFPRQIQRQARRVPPPIAHRIGCKVFKMYVILKERYHEVNSYNFMNSWLIVPRQIPAQIPATNSQSSPITHTGWTNVLEFVMLLSEFDHEVDCYMLIMNKTASHEYTT